jgi:hypothetical protein
VRGLEPEDWTCPFANVRLGFLGAVSLVGLWDLLGGSVPFGSLLEVEEVLIAEVGRLGILLGGGMLFNVEVEAVRLMPWRPTVD